MSCRVSTLADEVIRVRDRDHAWACSGTGIACCGGRTGMTATPAREGTSSPVCAFLGPVEPSVACAGIAWGSPRRGRPSFFFLREEISGKPRRRASEKSAKLFCAGLGRRVCAQREAAVLCATARYDSRRALVHVCGHCKILVLRSRGLRPEFPPPLPPKHHILQTNPDLPLTTEPNLFCSSCWLPESAREEKQRYIRDSFPCCLTDANIESVGPSCHYPTLEKKKT